MDLEELRELSDNYEEAKKKFYNMGLITTNGKSFDEQKVLSFKYEVAKHNLYKHRRILEEYHQK